MRIKSLSIEGFRGFNVERTIPFHDRLTLIYAPNSYGKTSISEAFEFLLYGITSKVSAASSKEEYKGSCRNRHLSPDRKPRIILHSEHEGVDLTFDCELNDNDTSVRFVESTGSREMVSEWPVSTQGISSRPFILQHALKYLLLAKPDERFHGLARLLGLDTLDEIHSSIVALCTKPEKSIPSEVSSILTQAQSFESRAATLPSLSALYEELAKKDRTPDSIMKAVNKLAGLFVPAGTAQEGILGALLKKREDKIGKVFSGHVSFSAFSTYEVSAEDQDFAQILETLSEDFVLRYTSLVGLATLKYIEDRATFLDLGKSLIPFSQGKCPFCGQTLEAHGESHIEQQHAEIAGERAVYASLDGLRKELHQAVAQVTSLLNGVHERHNSRVKQFLANVDSIDQIREILSTAHTTQLLALEEALSAVSKVTESLDDAFSLAKDTLSRVSETLDTSTPDQTLLQPLVDRILSYTESAKSHRDTLAAQVDAASQAEQLIQHELDHLAGTEEITLLVDVIEFRNNFVKQARVQTILDDLRSLRKTADTYVADTMQKAVTGELSSRVLQWYEQIRTEGDPDVHFDGFDMGRTKKGDLKARRIEIKARSYGEELVSAVSSLSESKLNALGLCLSIATNLDPKSPFEFLIIDDPIQSLDAEHEARFVQVIRQLVEQEGKQILLLSHNKAWLEQVRAGCRSLNGYFYEITAYTKEGPHIVPVPWMKWRHRLSTVDAILKDSSADFVRLQQAEEEIRIVVAELASELYLQRTSSAVSPHGLNSSQISKMLTECGVSDALRDRIAQTFETTDASHHGGADYTPFRDRIRAYHSWTHELGALLSQ